MKFALIAGNKTEAAKGAKGTCPSCGSELIAKCGKVKVNHWAHKKISNCDPWWENETEWHRSWKNNFPNEWQEVIMSDEQTGEKHIADICTNRGFVIEFQHSQIDPQERASRENFYKNMVWVVDGTRLKNDYKRFLKGKKEFVLETSQGCFYVHFPDRCFPSTWLESAVPIIFDFRGTESISNPNDLRNYLYCFFPKKHMLWKLSHKSFIKDINTFGTLSPKRQ